MEEKAMISFLWSLMAGTFSAYSLYTFHRSLRVMIPYNAAAPSKSFPKNSIFSFESPDSLYILSRVFCDNGFGYDILPPNIGLYLSVPQRLTQCPQARQYEVTYHRNTAGS